MTYKGHIKNGSVVLDQPVQLPDGVQVDIAIHPSKDAGDSTFYERFADIIGSCPGLPTDMAENHDHYLHGQEKK